MSVTAAQARASDLLLVNGTVYTVDPLFSVVPVLALRNGLVTYAGRSEEEGAATLSSAARRIDLRGGAAVPGLIDSHLHFLTQGQRLSELDLALKEKDEILHLVSLEAARLGSGAWVLGRGWNHEQWREKAWPGREELDAAAPDNPVALTRADAHAMWVNSAALRLAGIDRDCPDPPGGEILRRADGEPLGILIDTPIFKIWAVLPPLTKDRALQACLTAQEDLFRHGITSVGDAWQNPDEHDCVQAAYRSGVLKIRIYGMLASVNLDDGPCFTGQLPVRGLFGERLSLAAFKVVLDGSLGSRSAWLTRDYADRAGHRGNGRYTDAQLRELILAPARQGFQICAHAIGDAAVRQALDVLEGLPEGLAGPQRRHRIEHFQIASPEDCARAVRLGVIPAMQTRHAAADKSMAEARLAPQELERSYPWRGLLDRGGIIANGSDSPMDSVNPFWGMHAAITRTPFSASAATPESLRMSREEALKSYTIWAAGAEFAEERKGSLEPGKLADVAVLDRDIMRCAEEDMLQARVLMTIVGGEIVHTAESG